MALLLWNEWLRFYLRTSPTGSYLDVEHLLVPFDGNYKSHVCWLTILIFIEYNISRFELTAINSPITIFSKDIIYVIDVDCGTATRKNHSNTVIRKTRQRSNCYSTNSVEPMLCPQLHLFHSAFGKFLGIERNFPTRTRIDRMWIFPARFRNTGK